MTEVQDSVKVGVPVGYTKVRDGLLPELLNKCQSTQLKYCTTTSERDLLIYFDRLQLRCGYTPARMQFLVRVNPSVFALVHHGSFSVMQCLWAVIGTVGKILMLLWQF